MRPPQPPVRLVISTALGPHRQLPGFTSTCTAAASCFPQDHDDDLYCARVAAGIRGIVVDIDYAISWDHPFPTAFEQSYAVVKMGV